MARLNAKHHRPPICGPQNLGARTSTCPLAGVSGGVYLLKSDFLHERLEDFFKNLILKLQSAHQIICYPPEVYIHS